MVAGGGAAGLNVVPIAASSAADRVLVPRTAGALSACGASTRDIIIEFSDQPVRARRGDFDLTAVERRARADRGAGRTSSLAATR